MTLFLSMLPFYLLGNFHCIGMCGPLVAMIGRHRFRWHYFFGRLCSFSLAGALAGGFGAVLGAIFNLYHLSAMTSFVFGALILLISVNQLGKWRIPGTRWIESRLATGSRVLTPLMLQDRRLPTFLFGFFTIALPCGQTIIVYSACALSGSLWIGLLNGALFALLTSPSLFLAMQTHRLLPQLRHRVQYLIGGMGLIVGLLAISRGLADLEMIPHLVLSQKHHLVIY